MIMLVVVIPDITMRITKTKSSSPKPAQTLATGNNRQKIIRSSRPMDNQTPNLGRASGMTVTALHGKRNTCGSCGRWQQARPRSRSETGGLGYSRIPAQGMELRKLRGMAKTQTVCRSETGSESARGIVADSTILGREKVPGHTLLQGGGKHAPDTKQSGCATWEKSQEKHKTNAMGWGTVAQYRMTRPPST